MLICSRCHKVMERGKGVDSSVEINSLVGVNYTLTIPKGSTPQQEAFLRKQWGKYAPPDGEKTVTVMFCYECWIDSVFHDKDEEGLVFKRLRNEQEICEMEEKSGTHE